jgi:MFS family permease
MDAQSRVDNVKNRLINIAKLTVVLGLSLFLLIFIGQGEARRTYPQFEIEKLAAQGELAQIGMRNLLMADIPLDQFPGFATLTQPILDSDSSIHAIYVTDNAGEAIYSNVQPRGGGTASLDLADPALLSRFHESPLQSQGGRYSVSEDEDFYQVSFDLENRFAKVGQLHIVMPKSVVERTISSSFDNAKLAAAGLLALYAIFLFLTSKQWLGSDESGWEKGGVRLLGISYAASFLIIAAVVVLTLVGIYSDGIIAKTESLADSLEYRLGSAFELGLSLDDFTGVDATFAGYQELNPDLSYVLLTEDGRLVIDTGSDELGTAWTPREDHFDSARNLGSDSPAGSGLILHLGIPKNVVYNRLWRSAKNFVALFVASAFLTQLFFSLIRSQSNQPELTPGTLHTKRGFLLSLIGPLYFIMVFVTSGLNASFLPQYFQELAQKAGTQIDSSTLFSIYYAAYAVALLVTGRLAERRGPKPLLLVGGGLILVALLLLIFVPNYYVLFLVQATTGFGEGTFFIAVQSYVLKVASQRQRTKAAAIIVNSLYGGLLSGTAIGSLLAADPTVGHQGVFILGGLITVFILFYTAGLIPRIVNEVFDRDRESAAAMAQALGMEDATMTLYAPGRGGRSSVVKVLKDLDFVRTAILIGVPVKIIMAGLFKASLPLILTRQDFSTDDVGQVMMLYSVGVLVSSAIIPRIADRMGKTRLILFLGAVGSGLGLVLIGLMGWDRIVGTGLAYLATTLLLTGMVVLGISHGFIQAPIMTHVSATKTARRMGKSTATSIYRLIERVGNIGGPVIVGALLVKSGYDAMTVGWIGVAVIVFGLLFVIQIRKRKVAR